MASALSDAAIVFVNTRNTSGIKPEKKQLAAIKAEFDKFSKRTNLSKPITKMKVVHFTGSE